MNKINQNINNPRYPTDSLGQDCRGKKTRTDYVTQNSETTLNQRAIVNIQSTETHTEGKMNFNDLIGDVLKVIIIKFDLKTILSFRLIDKFCYQLFSKTGPCFIPIDLGIKALSDKPKLLEFAQVNNIDGVTLKQGNADDVKHLIAFLKDEEYQDLWGRVEGIEIGKIKSENSKLVKELLDLLSLKCPKLKSFSCGDICQNATLTLPKGLTSLESFFCRDIWYNARLTLPEELPMLKLIRCGKWMRNREIFKQLEALKAQCESRMG